MTEIVIILHILALKDLGLFTEALSVLMLCAPNNRRRPFSYHTKMADFEYLSVLSVFSCEKEKRQTVRKVY